nr:hypothetical protein [Tanacetum cinerariifolium]
MDHLEKQLHQDNLLIANVMNTFKMIKKPFQKFFQSKLVNPHNSDVREAREDFKEYTGMEAQSFRDLIIQNLDSIDKCIAERKLHDQKTMMRLNERKLQMQECNIIVVQTCDANIVVTESSRRESTIRPKEFVDSSVYKDSSGTRSGTQNTYLRYRLIGTGDNNDYNVFSMETEHPKKHESVNNTYLEEQGDTNITPDSSDMSNNGEEADQDDQMFQIER